MRLLKRIGASLFTWIAAALRYVHPKQECRILMYHSIGTPIPDDAQRRYTLSPLDFALHMKSLKESGVHLVSLSSRDYPPGVAVSFDDGYRNNLLVAYPVLHELQIPFTIFVTAKNIISGDPIYLTSADLKVLAADPLVTIGAHGLSHTPLTSLADIELEFELSESRRLLEDVIEKPVLGMSYPHGAVDTRVKAAVEAAGYQWAACSRFGTNRRDADQYALARTDIWRTDTLSAFKRKLNGAWDWMGYVR